MVSVEVFVMVTPVRAATVTPLLMPTPPAGLVNLQWATVRPPGLTHMARIRSRAPIQLRECKHFQRLRGGADVAHGCGGKVGSLRAVAHAGLPPIRTCASRASGSSDDGFTAGRQSVLGNQEMGSATSRAGVY